MNDIVVLLVTIPVLAAIGIALGMPHKATAVMAVVGNMVLTVLVGAHFDTTQPGYQFIFSMPCMELKNFFPIHLTLGVDGLSLPMVFLTAVISLVAVLVSPSTIKRPSEFFVCLLLISAGAMGAFLSLDLFFLYIFHEVALIPTFLLIGIWGGQERKFAAIQMTLYLAAGSLILLAGIFGLYFWVGPDLQSLDLRDLHENLKIARVQNDLEMQNVVFLLLLVGFGILVSLWPFHSWAPQGYASAPAPVAMLHAGVLKKFGLYGLLRLAVPYLPEGMESCMNILLVLLFFNIVYIGLVTIYQKELNLMLGYSSVMHMGYLFLGIACLFPMGKSNQFLMGDVLTGYSGVVLLMVGHGLSAALLFGLAAEIRKLTGTLQLNELGGLATKAPQLAFLFVLGGMASIGLPGLANFPGELMIFFGAWNHFPWMTIVAVFGVVLSAVYMLRAIRSIFYGDMPQRVASIDDSKSSEIRYWPYAILALSLLILGIMPSLVIDVLKPTVLGYIGGSF